MKYFILTLGLFLTTNIGFAQETKRLTAEKHNEYGLIYSLPQTHLDIEVVATKTTRKAGPYYQYAEKYLGIPEPITRRNIKRNTIRITIRSTPVSQS